MPIFSRVCLSACLVLSAATAALAQAIPDEVRNQIAERGDAPIIVGVRLPSFQVEGGLSQADIAAQQAAIREAIDTVLSRITSGVTLGHRFERIPFFSARVDATGLAALSSSPDVTSIELDVAEPPSLAQSVPLVNAPAAHAAGSTGATWRVAVLDTGVQTTHPFLAGKTVGEACYSNANGAGTGVSVCPGGVFQSTAPGSGVNCSLSTNGCNHGTHVAGIAVGSGATFTGVAPGAQLLSMQVFTQFNDSATCGGTPPCVLSYLSDQIRALERVLALAGANNVNQVASANMSLGGGQFFDQATCDANNVARKAAIDNLRSIGVPTVAASGNNGFTSSMGAPGCISSAVSVGSTTKSDVISSFSNRASFLSLMAPGSAINSSVPTNAFASFNGTSMATPHVAGAWAVLKHAKPGASVTEILNALRATGVPIPEGANTYRRINVGAARTALLSGTGPPGQPTVTSAVASGGNLTVTWTSGPGGAPAAHQLNFYSGVTLVATLTVGAGTSAVIPLPAGVTGTFAVQVIAGNSFGSSPPSAPFTFTIGGTAPGMPTVTSATESGGVLTVQWTLAAGASPTSHRLDFYQGAALVAQITTGAATSAAIPLPPGIIGTFGVRVTAFNGAISGPTSALFTFTLGPSCTTPAQPIVTGSIVGGTATVTWNAVPGATHYIVSAGSTQGGADYLPPTNFTGTGVSAPGLPAGFTAWVRVIAVNACGQQGPPRDFFLQ